MKRTLTFATLIALGAAAYVPLPSMAQASYSIVISSAPPAPLYERAPAPRRGYVWSPGHWEWRGHHHEWVGGYWIAERPGYSYLAPAWYPRHGGWYLEPARWQPYQAQPYYGQPYYGRDRDRDGIPDRYEWRRHERDRWERRHDQDHDGIPNRYDHDRDGDGVPNRYDRDRDGDGVPNRYDRDPDSWRRR